MTRTAVIIGANGQDGRIIAEYLKKKSYILYAINRDGTTQLFNTESRHDAISISEPGSIIGFLKEVQPDEIYYLAAFNQSSEDPILTDIDLFQHSQNVHVTGLLYVLEAIKIFTPATKLFYAASSLIFEGTKTEIQDEQTQYSPLSIYALTKLSGLLLCRYYREKYGVFSSAGILYNHESEYRRENYLSMKVIKAAIEIKRGVRENLIIGDLSTQIDWGYARDYIEAMHRILSCSTPDEYIIATGKMHSVEEFVEMVFSVLELDWRRYVVVDSSILTRRRLPLMGSPLKVKERTGWIPKTSFQDMVRRIISVKTDGAMQ